MRRNHGLLLLASMMVASCALWESDKNAAPYTLYRNSQIEGAVRIHWATFDARESDQAYNLNNCAMASRLLNANLAAFAKANGEVPESGLGFWCEPGKYSKKGAVPSQFDAAFPTDV